MDTRLLILLPFTLAFTQDNVEIPKFTEGISNMTIPVGREAVLTCVVEDLLNYKVAWLRVDTQTILTIHGHVITKNHRIAVTHSDHRTWYLHIKDVRQTDKGWYMCQINTDPMKSQVGYLDVVVPPDILDYPTSTDMVVREGQNVTLRCAASGSPTPNVTWRREGGEGIPLTTGKEVSTIEGSTFNITRVNRLHMGAYLCIASNGVPPSVSKRIMLIVHFPPMITIQNQLVGAMLGQSMTLECHSEAYPKSINYWTRDKGDIIAHGPKYEPTLVDNAYKVLMKLTIKSVTQQDYGAYKCVSKNSLGETDGSIKLYQIPTPTTIATTPTTTQIPITEAQDTKTPPKPRDKEKGREGEKERKRLNMNQESNDLRVMGENININKDKTRKGDRDNRLLSGEADRSRLSSDSQGSRGIPPWFFLIIQGSCLAKLL
ncbi:lachesin-like isoform X2 [Macrosteles quadrilineatus]|uniref:lachesin-like isoform X2 n=1 Tax=Macrosteles quadrilineatus TaxID=74068 RepID=UPI0023E1BF65|nr:lachesin-like isoform X2 [Macrosteles quadrilineatus]